MAKRKTFSINKDLQEGLSQTMSAVKAYAGDLHFEVIPLDQIELDPDNPRDLHLNFNDLPSGPISSDPLYGVKKAEMENLQSLAQTITKEGVINPILVYKHGAKYRLVAGERRSLASMIAGKAEIKANILNQKPTDFRRSFLQWVENIEREDLSLSERLDNIRQLLRAYQKETASEDVVSATLIKNILGCSLPHAMNYHAVLNASDSVLQAIISNQLKSLEKAAMISKVDDATLQQHILQEAIAGASLKQLKSSTELHKKEKQQRLRESASKKLANRRGRKAEKVQLGSISDTKVIKRLVELSLEHESYKSYRQQFKNINWKDFKETELAFKSLLNIIQQTESNTK